MPNFGIKIKFPIRFIIATANVEIEKINVLLKEKYQFPLLGL